AVAGAQMESKHAPVLNVEALKYIRYDDEVTVVPDQPGITVDHHHAHVLRSAHQDAQITPVVARLQSSCFELNGERRLRQPVLDRRQLARLDLCLEDRRLDIGLCGSRIEEQQKKEDRQPDHEASSRRVASGSARTKWPSPNATIRGSWLGSTRNGFGQAVGSEAR